jgi:hypothetical protein
MQIRDSHLSHRILGGSQALGLDLALAPLMYFLDAGRMDAAIGNQLRQGHASGLSPYRVKARQQYGLRRVVDHHIHSGHLLKGSNITAFSTDDSTLHVVARKVHRRNHGL